MKDIKEGKVAQKLRKENRITKNMSIKKSLIELVSVWESTNDPIEIAKSAYIVYLEYNRHLPNEIEGIIKDIMIMEADECMIMGVDEINYLIKKLQNFAESLTINI